MSSYYFNNGGKVHSSSGALVPQQALLTNPFEVMDQTQEVEVGNEVEGWDSSFAVKKSKLCVRGHWRPSEDAKLKELVHQFGPQNWNYIAEHFQGRSGKSCRLRWFNQLDPRINRSNFTEDEETRLISAHNLYGNKWAMISRLFPGRKDNAIKNHWHVMKARRGKRDELKHYRRGKYLKFQRFCNVNVSNNAATSSVSTNSSIINNESASTCNNISLTASSATPIFMPFFNLDPIHNHQAYGSLMGLSEERKVQSEKVGFGNFFGAWNGCSNKNGVVDQPNYSDSNSEASESESVSRKRTTNLSNSSESENMYEDNIQKPFIDFLGVGDGCIETKQKW